MSVEILCSFCGKESFLKRDSVYEGFKKVGESLTCASCSHEYASESDVPFKKQIKKSSIFSEEDKPVAIKIFTDDDKPKTIDLFTDDEKTVNCRHCENYTVNPFTQRCSLHNKPVAATDSCPDFKQAKVPDEKESENDESQL